MTDLLSLVGADNCILFGLLLFARGMDLLSTWIATPNLALEANPIARRIGWRWGVLFNLAMCCGFALWPLPAIVIATTSILVAARNFQFAWLMRSASEDNYLSRMGERLRATPFSLFLLCLAAQAFLIAGVGGALILFGGAKIISVGIGTGIIGYAFAVVWFTLISARGRRRPALI